MDNGEFELHDFALRADHVVDPTMWSDESTTDHDDDLPTPAATTGEIDEELWLFGEEDGTEAADSSDALALDSDAKVDASSGTGAHAEGFSRDSKRARQGRPPSLTVDGAVASSQVPALDDGIDRWESGTTLPIEVAYALLSDTAKNCGGPRPKFLSFEDRGRLFMERSSSTRLPLVRSRRPRGSDRWCQGAELQPRKVEGVSFGHRGRGEIWLRAVYGTINLSQSSLGEPDEKLKYHMYRFRLMVAVCTISPVCKTVSS